ncbi:MAG: hypothetical protein IJU58_00800 [Clostridia bacterium]|nr:hypothetical protein [Clostridia bacterium]
MSIIFSFVIAVLSSICVISFSIKYYARQKFFVELNDFLQNLNTNVAFLQNNIHQVIAKSNTNSLIFNNILQSYDKFLSTKDEKVFNTEINQEKLILQSDRSQLIEYLLFLGHADCETQTFKTNAFLQYTKQRKEEVDNDVHTKAILIQKLGIIAGLMIFILLL